MSKSNITLLFRLLLICTILTGAVGAFLSPSFLRPIGLYGDDFFPHFGIQKIAHFLFGFWLTIIFFYSLWKPLSLMLRMVLCFLGTLTVSGGIEFSQRLCPGRSSNIMHLLPNLLGAFMALLILYVVYKLWKGRER